MPSDLATTTPTVRTTVVIDQTLQHRIALHQALVAAHTAQPDQPRPLILLADGDSWFDYPLTGPLPPASDTIVQLGQILSPPPLILNLAEHGDATTQLLGVKRRNRLLSALRDPQNGAFDAILFSGGGNDLVGDQFRLWLNDAAAVDNDPTNALNETALDDIMSVVQTAYRDLIAIRNQAGSSIPILVHGYDFARPTNNGVCGLRPWLCPSLLSRNWMQGTTPADIDKGAAIVALILAKFRSLMLQLASVPENNLVYVETQGTLAATEWANELHPKPPGFQKIARQFATALVDRFPGRAAVVTPVAAVSPGYDETG